MESPPNVVTMPIPIVPAAAVSCINEGTYVYVAVKGSLHSMDSSVFGLSKEEVTALSKRFSNSSTAIVNGVNIKGPPIEVINSLSQLGYKVVCSTGETEVVWTMQREL